MVPRDPAGPRIDGVDLGGGLSMVRNWMVVGFLTMSFLGMGRTQEPFDLLGRSELARLSASFEAVESLDGKKMSQADGRLLGSPGTLLIVKTQQGRWARVLVSQARQKLEGDKSLPIVFVDRFATCMDGEERALVQTGKEVRLFLGFRFSLDLGQVVPPEVPADFVILAEGKGLKIQKEKGTELWIAKQEVVAPKVGKPGAIDISKPFGPHWFTGHYRLYDDGRRMGRMEIEADKEGNLSGSLFSDKDNKRYDLFGKVNMPNHTAQFTVRFPRSEQFCQAWIFTADGAALVGTTRFGERETGFYATRVKD